MELSKDLSVMLRMGMNKCYISGPISGMENLNIESFNNAEIELKKLGFNTVNPHNIVKGNKEVDLLVMQMTETKNPSVIESNKREIWNICMKLDIKELLDCNCVAVLRGWQTSKGATVEILIAQKLGLKVFYAETLEDFDYIFNITRHGKDIV